MSSYLRTLGEFWLGFLQDTKAGRHSTHCKEGMKWQKMCNRNWQNENKDQNIIHEINENKTVLKICKGGVIKSNKCLKKLIQELTQEIMTQEKYEENKEKQYVVRY